jgi:hypothetical protein
VQSAFRKAVLYRLGAQAEREQLPPRDHTVLPCGQRPGLPGRLLIG